MALSLESYPEPHPVEVQILKYLNYVFTVIFTIELMLKIVSIPPKEFWRDKFNIFDVFIVALSLIELLFTSSEGTGLTALRAFRLFRLFKLFRFGDLRVLLESFAQTLAGIGNYLVLLLLFVYIESLLGMQMFAGKLKFDDESKYDLENGKSPRLNFDNLWNSFLTIFCILIGEDWNQIMYDGQRSTNKLMASVYFIVLVCLG